MSRAEQQDEALEHISNLLSEIRKEAQAVGHLTISERAVKFSAYVEKERTRLREEGLV